MTTKTKKADPFFTRGRGKKRTKKKSAKRGRRVTEREKAISDMLIAQKEVNNEPVLPEAPRIDSKASEVANGTSTPVAPSDAAEANVEPSEAKQGQEPPQTSDTPAATNEDSLGDKKITEADRLVAAQRRIIRFLMGKRNANHNERRTISQILTRSERYLRTVDRGLL